MVASGLLILNSKSGSLIYAQRFAAAFGLAGSSVEQLARDELRLGAMLFALHLNAAAAATNAANGDGLTLYHLGGLALRFCQSREEDLLLILLVPEACAAQTSNFLAEELLRRFTARFFNVKAQPLALTSHTTIKRQAFAADTSEAMHELVAWTLGRMRDATNALAVPTAAGGAPASNLKVAVQGLAAVLSAELCVALDGGAAATAAAQGQFLVLFGADGSDHVGNGQQQRRGGGGGGGCLPWRGHGRIKPKLRPPEAVHTPLRIWHASAPAAEASDDVRFLHELRAAYRHERIKAACALYSAPVQSTAAGDEVGCTVVLTRAPLVVRIQLAWRGGETRHSTDEMCMPTLVAAVAEALHDWMTPLSLSIAHLERRP